MDRLIETFCALVAVDSPSYGERMMCEELRRRLAELGIQAHEDDSARTSGSECGNLCAFVPGEGEPLLLSAHMDTVSPACGKRAVVHDDGTITSAGETVLGADCLAGVSVILEVLARLKERGAPHRPIELVFDTAEEAYCIGIQSFNFSTVRSKEVYVLDLDGPVGRAAWQAPTMISFRAEFAGRSTHAAFSPELGVHALKAACLGASRVPCGRAGETTVNLGTIHGGKADNVVPDLCVLTGEVRSFSDPAARQKLAEIEAIFCRAAEQTGAKLSFSSTDLCSAYHTAPESRPVQAYSRACRAAGIEPQFVSTYGGSVNNHFAAHGIEGLVIAAGMNNCHGVHEYTSCRELARAAQIVEALVCGI